VAVDASGNVYVADMGNSAVKKMPPGCASSSCVTTLGGGFYYPWAVAVDGSGNIYTAGPSNGVVTEMPPGCGSASCVTALGGGFYNPIGVAADASGNVYVADYGTNAVREMPPGCASSSCVTTLGGGFNGPYGVAVDANGNVYVADYFNNAVKEMPPGCTSSSCVITTLGGYFYQPNGVAVDAKGNVYVAPTGTFSVEEIMAHAVNFNTVPVGTTSAAIPLTFTFTSAGSISAPLVLTQGAKGLDFADAGTGSCTTNGSSYSYSAGDTCTVNATFTPTKAGTRYGGVELLSNSGTVVANAYVYGTGSGPQVIFPPGALSTLGGGFNNPNMMAVDGSGNVYVADENNSLLKEMPAGCASSSCVTTLGSGFDRPVGVAVDGSGNVYVTEYFENTVVEMPAGCVSSSCITTLGGGYDDPYGVAVDGSGNIYVANQAYPTSNSSVVEMPPGCASSGCVTTLGGGFNWPEGVAVDGSGNIYVADTGNSAVKEMPPGCASLSCVTTLGGGFSTPAGVAVDGTGNVYVGDYGTGAVKEMPPGCASLSCVTTLAAGFNRPQGIVVDGSGNVYFGDSGNDTVRELNVANPPNLSFASTGVGMESSDSPKPVLVENFGNQALKAVAPGLAFTVPSFTQAAGTGTPPDCDSSFELAPGADCNISIRFTPTVSGNISGSLVLTDNNLNASNANQTIGLSGTGLEPSLTITWPRPSSITYGTALSLAQLDATSSVSGSFTYSPAAGTVPKAGIQTLSATFTPADTSKYTTATATVFLIVNKATPAITWATPAAITFGTGLGASQLNATATVPGAFYYDPEAGAVLPIGSKTLSVTFIPTDTANYLSSKASVPLTVSQGVTPEITWATPAPITYGTALGATQLNASSSVAGSFTYSPAAGTILKAGIQALSATFTPATPTSYSTATASVFLTVNKVPATVTWATPAAIPYGTPLGASQLNATSAVPGTFYYYPEAGAVLSIGSHTLSVTFIPTDTADYLSSNATVTLTVN
jgi:streptogramin lyase